MLTASVALFRGGGGNSRSHSSTFKKFKSREYVERSLRILWLLDAEKFVFLLPKQTFPEAATANDFS